jgi:pyrroline-5-carboxylate reductase
MKLEIAFVGAGRMVSAIVNGLLTENIFRPEEMGCVSAPDGTSEKLSEATGIGRADTLEELLASGSKRLLLGCKPQQFNDLDTGLAEWTADCTVLSIMAGITLEVMARSFPKARHLVRSMPNTPGQIGAGVTAYAFGGAADDEAKADVERILGSLGRVFAVEEPQIDAVTAMSGSGPGYVFEFACALEEAGVGIGLEKEFARTLAIETILGSGRLMARSDEHPETLRNYVTSPNGTTQAALERLTEGDFRKLIADAVSAARDRSLELSRPDA